MQMITFQCLLFLLHQKLQRRVGNQEESRSLMKTNIKCGKQLCERKETVRPRLLLLAEQQRSEPMPREWRRRLSLLLLCGNPVSREETLPNLHPLHSMTMTSHNLWKNFPRSIKEMDGRCTFAIPLRRSLLEIDFGRKS